MNQDFIKEANRFLNDYIDNLDISDSNFKIAVDRYKAIGKWLERPESKLHLYHPQIYPQGSFRLGTVVKPTTDLDEYDIDLVCQVDIEKTSITQAALKDMFGEELIAYAEANNMKTKPKPGKRCWKMTYADDICFHMDILPAVPEDYNTKQSLLNQGISDEWARHAVAITDIRNSNYHSKSNNWESSNPKGYALWFEDQMKVAAEQRKRLLVEKKYFAKMDEVPAFHWKTPLQRSIQLLKRHRDNMFNPDDQFKPISIIITTAAAHSYNNESDLIEALNKILLIMDKYIVKTVNGTEVSNPVNPLENFTEKWKSDPQYEKTFMQWLTKARIDFNNSLQSGRIDEFIDAIKPSLGSNLVEKVAALSVGSSAPSIIISSETKPPMVNIVNPNKPHGMHKAK